MKKKRKLKEHQQPQVHEKLKGFELKIDKFGFLLILEKLQLLVIKKLFAFHNLFKKFL